MKYLLVFLVLIITASKISFSQEVKKPHYNKYIFDPKADPEKDLQEAMIKAKDQHKRVFVLVGGDWNYWSRMANHDLLKNKEFEPRYVIVRINFSPANKNSDILTKLNCPKDKGYPIFIIL